ncbi:hypothetical protein ACTXT7_014083 [Hymenolepis weldensis]
MDSMWSKFIEELDGLLLGDNQVIAKLTRMFYATSYTFQNDSGTVQLLRDFIKRIRSSPLDAYPILLELKLILNNNLRDPTECLPNIRSHRYNFRQTFSTENLSGVSHDEPPNHRRVNFITLSDSPRSTDSDQEEGEEKEAKVASRSRKRPYPDNFSDRVTRPTKKRNLVAKVQETNVNNFYKLRNLERTMLHISHEIQRLEAAELDLSDEDNSGYLRIDALKRQELKLWREYCRLKGSNPQVARFDRQVFRYNGSRFPEINQAVENLVKSSYNMPDYLDVRKLVEDVYSTLSCPSVSRAIDKEAQKIFVDVCQKLKNRRELEFQRDIYHPPGADQPDADDDPALHSPGLRKRLKANERLAVSKFKSFLLLWSRCPLDITMLQMTPNRSEIEGRQKCNYSAKTIHVDTSRLHIILTDDSESVRSLVFPHSDKDDGCLRDALLELPIPKQNNASMTFKLVITKYSRLQEELEENQGVDLENRASEDYQPSSITQPTFDECEAEEPLPISTEDAQISCPIFEERESSGEVPPPPKMPSSGADSSNSSPETIVITDGEEDTISSNINDDDDDEPEIVGVEYGKPLTRNRPSPSEAAAPFSSQNSLQHTTVNRRRFALPLKNGSTMLFSMAEQHVVQIIPRSS